MNKKKIDACLCVVPHTPTVCGMHDQRKGEKKIGEKGAFNNHEMESIQKQHPKCASIDTWHREKTNNSNSNVSNSIDRNLIALAFLLSCCCQLSLKSQFFFLSSFRSNNYLCHFCFVFLLKWFLNDNLHWHKTFTTITYWVRERSLAYRWINNKKTISWTISWMVFGVKELIFYSNSVRAVRQTA